MSAHTNQPRPMTTLFFLIGALAFTMSSLPGGKGHVQSRSLSSVDGCDMEDQLNSGNSAGCEVQDGEASGRVDANLVDKTTKVRNADDFSKIDTVTTQVWRVKVTDLKVDGLETENCKECDEIRRHMDDHIDVTDLRDLKHVAEVAHDLFEKQAKALTEAAAKAKALTKRHEACEVDADGNDLSGTKEILSCKVDRLNSITDKDKAAEYYDENVQQDLQNLIISDNPADVKLAARLMGRDSALAKNRNAYVRQSLSELALFGQYSGAVHTLQDQILNGNANQQQAARAQLAQLKSSWGTKFAQEGYRVQSLNPPGFGDFAFGDSLYQDVMGQGGYNDSLNSIVNLHNQAINGTGLSDPNNTTGIQQAGDSARTLHGQVMNPSTSLGNGAINQQQPFGVQQQRLPLQQTNSGIPMNNGVPAAGSRRLGAPVQLPAR